MNKCIQNQLFNKADKLIKIIIKKKKSQQTNTKLEMKNRIMITDIKELYKRIYMCLCGNKFENLEK